MKTQTAVEWLVDKLNQCEPMYSGIQSPDHKQYLDSLIEQAKKIEKEQIIDFQLYMHENEFISNHLWDFEYMAIKFLNSKKQDL